MINIPGTSYSLTDFEDGYGKLVQTANPELPYIHEMHSKEYDTIADWVQKYCQKQFVEVYGMEVV